MRIVHIMDPDSRGKMGISEVVINLSHHQILIGNEVQVFMLQDCKYYTDPRLLFVVKTNTDFLNRVSTFAPQIVIFHSLYKPQYIKWYKILRRLHIPYTIEMHGGSSQANQKKSYLKKKIANILMFNSFIKQSSAIIYLNQGEKNDSVFKTYSKNLILPNGIDLPQNWEIKKTGSDDNIRITFLGRIDIHHKGLDLLVNAIKLAHDDLSKKISFHFYGYAYDQRFQKLIKPLGDLVYYHGPVYNSKKEAVLNKSNLFIHTSRYEGMPMSIIEALAHGIPCIVTPQTYMANLIQENQAGWVTSLNVEDIAKTILHAIGDYRKDPIPWQQNARKSIQRFTWDHIAQLSIQKYKQVIKSSSQASHYERS